MDGITSPIGLSYNNYTGVQDAYNGGVLPTVTVTDSSGKKPSNGPTVWNGVLNTIGTISTSLPGIITALKYDGKATQNNQDDSLKSFLSGFQSGQSSNKGDGKSNYTVYIIGGAIVVIGVLALILLRKKK